MSKFTGSGCSLSDIDFQTYDAIVVGAGFAGATCARELAERTGRRVAVLEQRPHIGGNAFDELDEHGILVHRYGPHIFHTASERVFNYLSRFTAWRDYQHTVLADINGTYTPVPFNLDSIAMHFPADKAERLTKRLLDAYPDGSKVPIIELRQTDDELLKELADFVYENVFLHYTMKQWGLRPEEVDPSVTARVPVLVGHDGRYFQDRWQGMPLEGYTGLFERLLDHPLIDVHLGIDAREALAFEACGAGLPFNAVRAGGKPFGGELVYTGPLDLLAGQCFGLLPYRSLHFVYKNLSQRHVLPCGTVNYTVSEEYTRITEYTWLTGQEAESTTIMEEYPQAFTDPEEQIPYYAIINEANQEKYRRYLALFAGLKGFYALGRLAQYRYFNMDQIVESALELADGICGL